MSQLSHRKIDRPPVRPPQLLKRRSHLSGEEGIVAPDALSQAKVQSRRLTPEQMIVLQRTVGNAVVGRLMQPKLVPRERAPSDALQTKPPMRSLNFQTTQLAQALVIQRKLSKRDAKIKKAVEALVKDGKEDEALDLICKKYGFTGKNFEIKVVPAMADSWATTGGEIKEGAKQTLSIGKDLFAEDFTFIVRTIGHEFQHLKQRSQKDPIENQKEREFLSWGWEALDTTGPTYSLSVAAEHARKALEFYDAMPEERQKLSANKKKKKALDKLIKKADAAAEP
jgi:hypothetical protein